MRFVRVAGAVLACVLSLSAVHAADSIENYRLTEKRLAQYERATEAMYQYARKHPEVIGALDAREDESNEESDTMDVHRMAQDFDKVAPGLREAMEASGMSLEEYFTFSISLAANALGAALAEQFGAPADDAALTELQRANIEFARKNMGRFQAFGERMQSEYADVVEMKDEDSDESMYDEEFMDDEEMPEDESGY